MMARMIRFTRLLVLIVMVVATRAGGEEAGKALHQTAAIPLEVKGRIDHFAADLLHKRMFVCALGNDTVEVIDVDAGKVVHHVEGLKHPQGCGYATDLDRLAIASDGDGTCRLFDGSKFQPLNVVNLKDDADNVRYDPQAKQLWVGFGDGALAAIDPASGKKLVEVALKGHPESFQLESSGGHIFVNVPKARHVAVVDRQLRKVVVQWPIREAKNNFAMALDEADHRLLVVCRDPAKLLVLDTESGKTVASIDCVGDADDVWYDPTDKRIYISGGEGYVTVIRQKNRDQYEPLAKIQTAPGARTSLFVPPWHTLFVAVPARGDQHAEVRVYK